MSPPGVKRPAADDHDDDHDDATKRARAEPPCLTCQPQDNPQLHSLLLRAGMSSDKASQISSAPSCPVHGVERTCPPIPAAFVPVFILLPEICTILAESNGHGTLAAMMRTARDLYPAASEALYRRLEVTGTNGLELRTNWDQIVAGLWLDRKIARIDDDREAGEDLAERDPDAWPGVTSTIRKLRLLSLVKFLVFTLEPREDALARFVRMLGIQTGSLFERMHGDSPPCIDRQGLDAEQLLSHAERALREDPLCQVQWPSPFPNVRVIELSASVVLTRARQIQSYLADGDEELISERPSPLVLILAECSPDTVCVSVPCCEGFQPYLTWRVVCAGVEGCLESDNDDDDDSNNDDDNDDGTQNGEAPPPPAPFRLLGTLHEARIPARVYTAIAVVEYRNAPTQLQWLTQLASYAWSVNVMSLHGWDPHTPLPSMPTRTLRVFLDPEAHIRARDFDWLVMDIIRQHGARPDAIELVGTGAMFSMPSCGCLGAQCQAVAKYRRAAARAAASVKNPRGEEYGEDDVYSHTTKITAPHWADAEPCVCGRKAAGTDPKAPLLREGLTSPECLPSAHGLRSAAPPSH